MNAPNPLDTGIWHRFIENDRIDYGLWIRARAASELVGECRICGGYLAPGSVYHAGQTEWYEARCLACGREVAAPGGRVLRRSARRSEQPAGWWDERIEAMSCG